MCPIVFSRCERNNLLSSGKQTKVVHRSTDTNDGDYRLRANGIY
jgi:hypothetical protein